MHICIFEDRGYESLLPLVYMRPAFDLRCGVLTVREKLSALAPGARTTLVLRPELAAVAAAPGRGVALNAPPPGACWLLNGRLLPDAQVASLLKLRPKTSRAWTAGGDLAAAYLDAGAVARASGMFAAGLLDASIVPPGASEETDLQLIRYPWDLVHRSAEEIVRDFRFVRKSRAPRGRTGAGVHVVNRRDVSIGAGVSLKPGVVLDASDGPIVIGAGASILPNAVVMGPASIGNGTMIKAGAKIYPGTSIGERCKAGGEIEASVIHGYSNKQHEGYLGHSVLGSWVNIGADTNTSDLKNTYGTVKVPVNGALVDSGSLFVGSMIGDHAKTGINVMLDTGTVVGVSANVFGAGVPPKTIPSFSWGGRDAMTSYDLEQAVESGRRMMRRRSVEMTPAYEALFRFVHAATARERSGGRRNGA
jgi:UDP-N-acetylglucosamine diphosphorylase/glucosamine-1-phosphate N-acetyltransferase